MNRIITKGILILLLLCIGTSLYSWPGYRIIYKEQYYKLYHQQLYMYPEDYAENIHWLENALRADFANPLNAFARIETKEEWEWYRNHFYLHLNLQLVKNYMRWASKYMKRHAYFFNAPWKEENIKSFEKAKKLVAMAEIYWSEALKYSEVITDMNLYFMNLEGIQNWEDEYTRVMNGDLDYEDIISREKKLILKLSAEFEAMDSTTY